MDVVTSRGDSVEPQNRKREGKSPYEAPTVFSYSAEEIGAALGPAVALYGPLP